jgi:hypothetical protein
VPLVHPLHVVLDLEDVLLGKLNRDKSIVVLMKLLRLPMTTGKKLRIVEIVILIR